MAPSVRAESFPASPRECRNKLIAALPPGEYQELYPHLRIVPLAVREILHRRGDTVHAVYFPGGGACSLLSSDPDGPSAEIAAIGSEGVVGAGVFFGQDVTGDAVVSVGDNAGYVIDVGAFNQAMARRAGLHNLVVRYSQALIGQALQLTVCNRAHPAEARASRWLLTAHDRLGRDQFPLQLDVLANVLGLPADKAGRIAGALVRAGAVALSPGWIHIADRAALQQRTCECYSIIATLLSRLMPELDTPRPR